MAGTPLDNELIELKRISRELKIELAVLDERIGKLERPQHAAVAEFDAAAEFMIPGTVPKPPTAEVSGVKEPAVPHAMAPDSPKRSKSHDIEILIGQTWLNRVGAFILFLAFAFFIKYAFDRGWLSPSTRVIIAGTGGLVLVGAGQFCLHRAMRAIAGGFIGCGIGVLYLAAYGAYNFYHLVDDFPAFVLYTGVTVLSIAVSVRGRLLSIAILAVIGGFGTPIALSTGADAQVALLTYVLALDVGFLVCAHLRGWDALRTLSWLGTIGLFGGWFVEFYAEPAVWRTAGFILTFYVLFHAEALACVRRGATSRPREIGHLVHFNNAVFFVSSFFLLRNEIPQWLGLLTITAAALQWFCAWRVLSSDAPIVLPARMSLWLDGATMLALAAPIQFDRYLVSVSWAVQAAVTFWFCRSVDRPWLRAKGAAVLLAAIVHLLLIDRFDEQLGRTLWSVGHWTLAWITPCFVFVGACAYFGGAALTIHRQAPPRDRSMSALLFILGSALMLGIFADQWERYLATWWWLGLAGAWLIVARRVPQAVALAMAIALATGVKFVVSDTLGAVTTGTWSDIEGIVLNRAVLTGCLVAIMLVFVRVAIQRHAPDPVDGFDLSSLPTVLALVATIAIIWVGTFEVLRVFQFEAFRHRFTDAGLAMHVALSLFWSVSAIVLVILGFARRVAVLRHVALGLFGLTVAKVLIFDLAQLDTIYRIVSFVILGVLLLLASLLYQRLSSGAMNATEDRSRR